MQKYPSYGLPGEREFDQTFPLASLLSGGRSA